MIILPIDRVAGKERRGRRTRPGHWFKRGIDLVLAALGLTVLLPVFFLIAIAIVLDNPGPILYRQERVGLNRRRAGRRISYRGRDRREQDAFGRPFKIYKFRSMVADAEATTGPVWAAAKDSRITRVGNFLRRSRLDETPQLWNVILGDMSIVGPRPERPTFVRSLTDSLPDYPKRCAAMPGITGLAQVKSRYDTSVESADRKLQYDLYYLQHGRFLLDLKIMAATVKVMARGDGAH